MAMSDTAHDLDRPEEINDPEEYVNRRRLESIFKIRDRLHDARLQIRAKDTDRYAAVSNYRSLVDSYVIEIEPLLRRYGDGPELLTDRNFGVLEIEPTTRKSARAGSAATQVHVDGDWLTVKTPPRSVRYELHGLNSLFRLGDPVTHTFTADAGSLGNRTVSWEVETQPDFGTLDAMVREVNDFLAEIGFELDADDGDTWEI